MKLIKKIQIHISSHSQSTSSQVLVILVCMYVYISRFQKALQLLTPVENELKFEITIKKPIDWSETTMLIP